MPTEPEPESEHLHYTLEQAVDQVREWVIIERREYADKKFKNIRVKEVATLIEDPHLESNPHIFHGILDYLKRVEQFGVDSLQGRQALGKALITVESLLSDSIVAHGNMPTPGVPSGELSEWSLWK